MLQNFLRLSMRHLWRNRLFTLLNVTGLAIGISASWIMYQYAAYEYGFDAGNPLCDRIHRVATSYEMDGQEFGNSGAPTAMLQTAQTVSGVEMAVPVSDQFVFTVRTGNNDQKFEKVDKVVHTTNDYFKLFPYRWLAGEPTSALSNPGQIVLTQSRAERYFPGVKMADVMGRRLIHNDTAELVVSGVVADLDFPSSMVGKEFLVKKPILKPDWTGVNSGNQFYILLAEGADREAVAAQINRVSYDNIKEDLEKMKYSRTHVLHSLREMHFEPKFTGHFPTTNKKVLYVLMGIAGFLLLLACINYVNLATAQIPQRAREIGIRKTLGSSRKTLLTQFLGETALVTILAVALSAGLTSLFFKQYGNLVPEDILAYVHWQPTAVFLVVLVAVVTLLAGSYPGWLITRAEPVRILRGQADTLTPRGGRVNLRKGLIVFQFAIAQVFIVGAIIVWQQLHFMLNNDLGFRRDAVVFVEVPWVLKEKPEYADKHFVLLENIKKLPGVQQAALGDPLLYLSYMANTFYSNPEGKEKVQHNMLIKYTDEELLPLYEVPLLAGRYLEPGDTAKEYVVNETAVKTFGFANPQSALGQILSTEDGGAFPIVGVVADFHMASFSEKIEPLALVNGRDQLSTLNIKMASSLPADWQPVLEGLEKLWRQFYPSETFKYTFFDETLETIYEDEKRMAGIVNLATGVALLISCLGLFGLAMFMAHRRTKEIGVRKVLGAGVFQVALMLVRDFLILVGIAIALASPLAYILMQKWLTNYAYHVPLNVWVLVGAGAVAVVTATLTVGFQSLRAALANPVQSLRSE
ncbi:MAG: ABC transporter permease [Saprospiraceae bacterium]|nr:ABC transporter permease [Saprospiraceae bacterium]